MSTFMRWPLAAATLWLAACTVEAPGTDDPPDDTPDPLRVALILDVGGTGDNSFNDTAVAGLVRAESELDITTTQLVPASQDDRSSLVDGAAADHDVVIGVGFLFEETIAILGPTHPDTHFAVIDSAMLDFSGSAPVPYADNIAGYVFAEEQGSFLVGAAAALKSQTGTVGFIGGVSGFGLIEKFQAGFEAGAMAADGDVVIVSDYVSAAPDFSGFGDPDSAELIATGMYEGGADVIYHASGASGGGLFKAAVAHSAATTHVWSIGVDSDQYLTAPSTHQPHILTSMLKRVDTAVYEIIAAVLDDGLEAGATRLDLELEGVGYATSGGFIDDITTEIDGYAQQIISGDIVVPEVPQSTR